MAKWKRDHQLKVRGQNRMEAVRNILHKVKLNYSTESLTYDWSYNLIEKTAEGNLK